MQLVLTYFLSMLQSAQTVKEKVEDTWSTNKNKDGVEERGEG